MTPEARRIAIAEACGWKDIQPCTCKLKPRGHRTVDSELEHIPNFVYDLNAMHEAEKVLTDTRENDQWSRYCTILNKLTCRLGCGNFKECGFTFAATASQRAEAFLRTIGKWQEYS